MFIMSVEVNENVLNSQSILGNHLQSLHLNSLVRSPVLTFEMSPTQLAFPI